MPRVSLQPAAGAHGEFTGLLMMRAYHRERGDTERTRILIPDSAHGTNPASTTMAGFTAVELPSDARGNVDLEAVRAACDGTVAGIMMTNPNTLGLFEEHIDEVVRLVHDCGGLVYGDGANLNAIAGIARPGDLGFDVMHLQSAQDVLDPAWRRRAGLRPGRRVGTARRVPAGPADRGRARRRRRGATSPCSPRKSIGRVSPFFGNFGMLVRAYAYIKRHGAAGLRANSEHAVLNANYLRDRAARRLRGAVRPHQHARIRLSAAQSTEPAYGRSTSPSGCSTTASIRRPTTFRWSCRRR